MEQKEYTNGEVTVVWKPDVCIHSTICWKGLIEVFNPKKRPWVDINGAATEQIIEQVKKCPSGALSYFLNHESQTEATSIETIVEVIPNGPLIVYGTIKVKNRSGEEKIHNQTTALCRCGGSGNKPYCDGTHTKNGFKDE